MTGSLSPREENALRQTMKEFADAESRPRAAGMEHLIARCRRARRRRRTGLAVATAVLAVSACGGVAAVAGGGTPSSVQPAISGAVPATGAALPELNLKPRVEDHSPDRGYPLPQPSQPVIGTSYPFNWFAHCGMVYISFTGRTWKVDHPVTVPKMHPDANGITWGPPIVPGYVTLTSPTTLRFDAPTYITRVALHLTTQTPPLCS